MYQHLKSNFLCLSWKFLFMVQFMAIVVVMFLASAYFHHEYSKEFLACNGKIRNTVP